MKGGCTVAAMVVCAVLGWIPPQARGAAGRTAGNAEVSQSGEATYSIPIFAPPGTHGLTPSLSLVYGSRGGSGWLGEGWAIGGLSTISRCALTWAQDGTPRNVRLDNNDRYCLDGNRLRAVAGTQGGDGAEYRTEIETFSRIRSWGVAGSGPEYFVAESNDGLIYEYGHSADSRIESLGVASVRTWAVNQIRDRDGNAMVFSYTEDAVNGGYRLASVQYTANAARGVAAAYRIEFIYQSQPLNEIDSGYLGGRRIQDVIRLIQVDVTYNAALVRRYEVRYEAGLSSTGKSRVQSIQECAGASGEECLAATSFSYQDGTPGWEAENSSGVAVATTPWSLDVNGDGRDDLVYCSSATSGGGTWRVMLANGAGGYDAPIETAISNVRYSDAIAIDYNADGREDLLVPYGGGTWWVMLGQGSGLAAPVDTGAPVTATGVGINAQALDVDGDGLEDLVWADLVGFSGGDAIRYRLRVNGGAFAATVNTLVGPLPADSMIANPVWGFPNLPGAVDPDFNGDGREDLLYRRRDREFVDGPNTWSYTHFTATVLSGAGPSLFSSGASSAPSYGDFNGDGLDDLLYLTSATTTRVRFGTGTGFTAEVAGPNPAAYQGNWVAYDWDGDGFEDLLAQNVSSGMWDLARSTGEAFLAPQSTGMASSSLHAVSELDGDGLEDLGYTVNGTWKYRRHAGRFPDLLLTVSDGLGNVTRFEYTSIVQGHYSKYADASFPEQDYAGALQVVRTLTAADGIGGSYTLSYDYYGARLHLQGRGLEGFEARRVQDSRNGLYSWEYYHRLFPYTGVLRQSDRYQADGTRLMARTQTTWTAHSYGSGYEARYLPYASGVSAVRYEVGGAYDGSVVSTTTTTHSVDAASGVVYDSTRTTREASSANGVQAGASYVQRVHQPLAELVNDTTNWCLGRAGRIEETRWHDQSGGAPITRTMQLSWDTSGCRVRQQVLEPGDVQLQVTTDFGYDGFGNVTTQSVSGAGMAARTRSTSWGADGRFPVSVSDALNQTTTQGWDAALGVPTSVTDPNGISTGWSYDGFGRRMREQRADGTATSWKYEDCASVGCVNANNQWVVIQTELDALGGAVTDRRVYLDRLERPIVASTRMLSGAYNRIDTEYDAYGRVARVSAPCWWGACTPYWTTYRYDLLERVTQVSRPVSDSNPAAATTFVYYEGLTTREVDALGTQRTQVANVLGGVVRSMDHEGFYQQFDVDGFGSVVRVTDSLGATLLANTYNIRGMRTAQSDRAAGDWSYTVNALGEVITQRDAKLQTTSFEYDLLGRLIRRSEAEGVSSWSWGSSVAARNVGRLEAVSGPGYVESYVYDELGRLTTQTISAEGTYSIDYRYNSLGMLDTLTYPVSTAGYRFKLQYEYRNGQLSAVKDFNAPATVYWTANDTDARGQIVAETLGNAVQTIRGYDAVTGRLDFLQSGLHSASYAWDAVGNLIQRQDLGQGLSESFTYDSLHRLSAVSGPEPMQFSYDARGNLLSQTGSASRGTSHTVSWTSYNLPGAIRGPSGYQSEFFYTPERTRWKQAASYGGTSETTLYVGGLLEKVTLGSLTSWKHYIRGGAGPIAIYTRTSGGSHEIHYLTQDHLGSVDAITDAAGSAELQLSFGAFGKRRHEATWSGQPSSNEWSAITDTTRRGYTFHEMLDNLDLVHMNGRVYDPGVGRFLSADPYIDGALSTQGWNRYAYVHNNPLSHTDPSGFRKRHYLLIHPRDWSPEVDGSNYVEVVVEGQRIYDSLALEPHIVEVTFRDRHLGSESETIERVITAATRLHRRPAVHFPNSSAGGGTSGKKCTFSDFVQDLGNAVRAAIHDLPNISLALEFQGAFGFDSSGRYSQHSFSLGVNSLLQGFAQMQGSSDLQGSGDIAVLSVGFNVGYASRALETGVGQVEATAGYAYIGPGISAGVEQGIGSAEGSLPTSAVPHSIGRLNGGIGLALGYLQGQSKEFTGATSALLGLIDRPGKYSGCGGRFQ